MPEKILNRVKLTILIAVLGVITWGLLIPLDSGVPSSGIVTVDGKRRVIQHPSGGVIRDIMVKEGDVVKKNQVLVRLENTHELANKSQIESQLASTQLQIEHFETILPALHGIAQEGFYPRNQWLELERKYNEAKALEISLHDKLLAADTDLDRTLIRSPIAGRIMGMEINTRGAVITVGQKLMEIVPVDDELTVEAQVRPHLIDKIFPGNQAQVRFPALQSAKTPVIHGNVQWVSADRFQNPNDKMYPEGYYLAKVIVTPQELVALGDFKVLPGMPAEVIIKTGERTLFQYLIKPLTDRFSHALREY